MIVQANAKINLGLNIVERRPDGYHNLETVFYPINLCDKLEITETSATACNISIDGIPIEGNIEDNLVVKAYTLLKTIYPTLPPVNIRLTKNIPAQAGMGGGSSDCAYTITMLNEMFSLGLDDRKMADYASRLGSDCAFFIYDRPMIGEGRGEKLTGYSFNGIRIQEDDDVSCGSGSEDRDTYVLKVVVPEGVHVSTADAYRGIVPAIPEIPLRDALSMPVEKWKDCLVNDFERTVFAEYPQLEAIKGSLYGSGAVYASMSGSGSALFALYRK